LDNKHLLTHKPFLEEPSQFKPENLLREARRQKHLANCPVPQVCVLDPDGDIVDYLVRSGNAKRNECWSCYHTDMFEFMFQELNIGIIGCAVGASFAVLLAEQLFVSGCQLLISITSAGIINKPKFDNTRYVLIKEALRDEGTSYHYIDQHQKAKLNTSLFNKINPLVTNPMLKLEAGKSWTTDAPYRETASAIEIAKKYGATAVEMEASALYAFAQAKDKSIVCYAQLTNTMAQQGDDFEKGEENGSLSSLQLILATANVLGFN
jgi:purine-nucleoside phosphorylase